MAKPNKKPEAAPPFEIPDWPASRVEMWKLDKIRPYENNPRVHSPEQISLLAASMREEGVTMPILVDDAGVIIAGHGRLDAAVENKFEEYPVVVARGWSEQKKRAARIKDNSISNLSEWSDELLRLEIGALKLEGYDVPLLGFDSHTLDLLSDLRETSERQDEKIICAKCGMTPEQIAAQREREITKAPTSKKKRETKAAPLESELTFEA